MKQRKILREILTILWRFNGQQNIPDSELLPEKVQKQIARQQFHPTNSLNLAWLHKRIQNTCKYAQQSCFNESKFRKQICLNWPLFYSKKGSNPLNLLLWVRGRSANVWFSLFKNCRCQTITKKLSSCCFAVGFWEVQSIKSQNFQNTDCVLNEYFQNFGSSVIKILRTGRHIHKIILSTARQDCISCDNQQEPISAREFVKNVIETDEWHPPKTHLAGWERNPWRARVRENRRKMAGADKRSSWKKKLEKKISPPERLVVSNVEMVALSNLPDTILLLEKFTQVS